MNDTMDIDIKKEITKLVINELRQKGLCAAKFYYKIPVSISARHVHLQREHLDILFGKDYQLTFLRKISQPGQYAANEKVSLISEKGSISNVRIIGPLRNQTQVEISKTDAHALKIKAEIRGSGKLDNTPGIILLGPKGRVILNEGVIVTERHVHMTYQDAELFGVSNGQKINVKVDGVKPGVMGNVSARVRDDYTLDMHIDTDDANAFFINNGDLLEIIR